MPARADGPGALQSDRGGGTRRAEQRVWWEAARRSSQQHTCAAWTRIFGKSASHGHTCAVVSFLGPGLLDQGGDLSFEALTAFAPQPPGVCRARHRSSSPPISSARKSKKSAVSASRRRGVRREASRGAGERSLTGPVAAGRLSQQHTCAGWTRIFGAGASHGHTCAVASYPWGRLLSGGGGFETLAALAPQPPVRLLNHR